MKNLNNPIKNYVQVLNGSIWQTVRFRGKYFCLLSELIDVLIWPNYKRKPGRIIKDDPEVEDYKLQPIRAEKKKIRQEWLMISYSSTSDTQLYISGI